MNNGLQLAHYSDAWLISLTSHLSTFKLIIQITDTFVHYLGGGLDNKPFNNWTHAQDLNNGLVGYSDTHHIQKLQFWLLVINLHVILGKHQYEVSLRTKSSQFLQLFFVCES